MDRAFLSFFGLPSWIFRGNCISDVQHYWYSFLFHMSPGSGFIVPRVWEITCCWNFCLTYKEEKVFVYAWSFPPFVSYHGFKVCWASCFGWRSDPGADCCGGCSPKLFWGMIYKMYVTCYEKMHTISVGIRSILTPTEVRGSNVGPQTCPSSIIDLMLNWSIYFFPFIEGYHFWILRSCISCWSCLVQFILSRYILWTLCEVLCAQVHIYLYAWWNDMVSASMVLKAICMTFISRNDHTWFQLILQLLR